MTKTEGPMIYGLIGEAMKKIGAIGKTAYNAQQKFNYRGIDAVYNALNPVMAELGLFICPEVLDQKREERTTSSGGLLKYTILTMKYTIYAPDGSSVSCVTVGEGMDSGDKSSNKAMSIAMKYAMFQLFFIPTEELVDPDGESHSDVLPRGAQPRQQPAAPAAVPQNRPAQAPAPQSNVLVTQSQTVPGGTKKEPTEAQKYINNELPFLAQKLGIPDLKTAKAKFAKMRKALIEKKVIPDVAGDQMTRGQAETLMKAIYANFVNTGGDAA